MIKKAISVSFHLFKWKFLKIFSEIIIINIDAIPYIGVQGPYNTPLSGLLAPVTKPNSISKIYPNIEYIKKELI